MEYIVLVGDGISGSPLDQLNGRATSEVAERRYMSAPSKVYQFLLVKVQHGQKG